MNEETGDIEEEVIITRCEDLIQGCEVCNDDASQCEDCVYGYYRFSRNGQYLCGSCGNQDLFGACQACDASRGCTECQPNNFHFGYKCYRSFW